MAFGFEFAPVSCGSGRSASACPLSSPGIVAALFTATISVRLPALFTAIALALIAMDESAVSTP